MPKKTPRPRPLSRVGRGKGSGARVFRGPVRLVTNSIEDEIPIEALRQLSHREYVDDGEWLEAVRTVT